MKISYNDLKTVTDYFSNKDEIGIYTTSTLRSSSLIFKIIRFDTIHEIVFERYGETHDEEYKCTLTKTKTEEFL